MQYYDFVLSWLHDASSYYFCQGPVGHRDRGAGGRPVVHGVACLPVNQRPPGHGGRPCRSDRRRVRHLLRARRLPRHHPGGAQQVDGRTTHHSVELRETAGRARAPHPQTPPAAIDVPTASTSPPLGAEPTNTRPPSSGPSAHRSSRPSTTRKVGSGSRCYGYGASLTHSGATSTTQMTPDTRLVGLRCRRRRPDRLGPAHRDHRPDQAGHSTGPIPSATSPQPSAT